jgi:hypothetical protein
MQKKRPFYFCIADDIMDRIIFLSLWSRTYLAIKKFQNKLLIVEDAAARARIYLSVRLILGARQQHL